MIGTLAVALVLCGFALGALAASFAIPYGSGGVVGAVSGVALVLGVAAGSAYASGSWWPLVLSVVLVVVVITVWAAVVNGASEDAYKRGLAKGRSENVSYLGRIGGEVE